MCKKLSLKKSLLQILSRIYAAVSAARNYAYDIGLFSVYTSALPVVSVGNLTAGGNGKTPLCLYLVQQLSERGFKPVVLSRGYGGRTRGPYLVKRDDPPGQVGDEPLLMAQISVAPVVVARDRIAGAKFIERAKIGDIIILDDGFQHRRLARQADIVSCFVGSQESIDSFVAGDLLPAGFFREDRDRGLKRASLFLASFRRVLAQGEEMPSLDQRLLDLIPSGIKVFRAAFEVLDLRSLKDGSTVAPCGVHAFVGIANPQGFFDSLEKIGCTIERKHEFPDHYHFSEHELEQLVRDNPGASFACTEKDGVKIRAMSEAVRGAFVELRVRLRVAPADAFIVSIMRMIQRGAVN